MKQYVRAVLFTVVLVILNNPAYALGFGHVPLAGHQVFNYTLHNGVEWMENEDFQKVMDSLQATPVGAVPSKLVGFAGILSTKITFKVPKKLFAATRKYRSANKVLRGRFNRALDEIRVFDPLNMGPQFGSQRGLYKFAPKGGKVRILFCVASGGSKVILAQWVKGTSKNELAIWNQAVADKQLYCK